MAGFRVCVLFSVVLAAVLCGAAAGEEWGDLELRLVYDGEPPAAPAAVAGIAPRRELLVNAKNQGIANVLVCLLAQPGEKVAANPMLEGAIEPKVTTSVLADKITPRVQIVHTIQTLEFVNLSPQGAYFKAEFFNNEPIKCLVPAAESVAVNFSQPESTPIPISNVLPPYHQAYIRVVDNPYAAVSDEDGKIKLSKLPVGKHTFVVWHEIPGYVKEAHHGGMPVEWKRGRMAVEIESGRNDFGEFLLKPAVFKR